MPSNIQNVNFTGPQALAAALNPNGYAQLQVQGQQIARQQQLADALRQQSLTDDQGNGGRVSWTQGLSRLADALISKRDYKRIDQQSQDYIGKQAALQGSLYGIGPQQQSAPPSPSAMPDDGASGTPNAPGNTDVAPQPTDQASNMPQGQPAAAPSPMSSIYPDLPGQGHMASMVQALSSPSTYYSGLNAANAPTDFAKQLQQSGIQPGTPLYDQIMQANIAKQNNIPLVAGRPGAPMYRPDGSIAAVSPQNIEGANPVVQDGHFTGSYSAAPGAAGVIAQTAAAKAGGSATYAPMTAFDPNTGAPIITTQAIAANAASGGHPMQAAPALGATAAADVTGKNSANAFQDISNGAADVPNRIYALNQMAGIAANPQAQFGAGSDGANHLRGVLATIGQSVGLPAADPTVATNANEFQKWATQYSARSGQELGLSGSDARTQLAVHATPNGEMTRAALQSVIPQMIGIENAKQGYANAANVWQQTHGPQTVQQFRAEWNKVYDPAIYTHMVQGPQAFAGWVKSLSPAQAAQARSKYLTLKQIGALPQ